MSNDVSVGDHNVRKHVFEAIKKCFELDRNSLGKVFRSWSNFVSLER